MDSPSEIARVLPLGRKRERLKPGAHPAGQAARLWTLKSAITPDPTHIGQTWLRSISSLGWGEKKV